MERLIAFKVFIMPEYQSILGTCLTIYATSFIFEQSDSPIPIVSFQIATKDEGSDDLDYETVVSMPMKSVLLIERLFIDIEPDMYYAQSTNISLQIRRIG